MVSTTRDDDARTPERPAVREIRALYQRARRELFEDSNALTTKLAEVERLRETVAADRARVDDLWAALAELGVDPDVDPASTFTTPTVTGP